MRKAADAMKSQTLFKASLWGGGDLMDELRADLEKGQEYCLSYELAGLENVPLVKCKTRDTTA